MLEKNFWKNHERLWNLLFVRAEASRLHLPVGIWISCPLLEDGKGYSKPWIENAFKRTDSNFGNYAYGTKQKLRQLDDFCKTYLQLVALITIIQIKRSSCLSTNADAHKWWSSVTFLSACTGRNAVLTGSAWATSRTHIQKTKHRNIL